MMKISKLLVEWDRDSHDKHPTSKLSIDIPQRQLADILALADLFPGRTQQQIITDLLGFALAEVEAALPYIRGDRVVTEDEFDEPVYDDIGMTPRFLALSQQHLHELKKSTPETA